MFFVWLSDTLYYFFSYKVRIVNVLQSFSYASLFFFLLSKMAEARMVTKEDLSGFYVLTTTEQIQVFFLAQVLTKFCKSFCPNKFYGSISPPCQGTLGFPKLLILEISDNEYDGSLPSTYFINWKASSLTMNDDGGLYMNYTNSVYTQYDLCMWNTRDFH